MPQCLVPTEGEHLQSSIPVACDSGRRSHDSTQTVPTRPAATDRQLPLMPYCPVAPNHKRLQATIHI